MAFSLNFGSSSAVDRRATDGVMLMRCGCLSSRTRSTQYVLMQGSSIELIMDLNFFWILKAQVVGVI